VCQVIGLSVSYLFSSGATASSSLMFSAIQLDPSPDAGNLYVQSLSDSGTATGFRSRGDLIGQVGWARALMWSEQGRVSFAAQRPDTVRAQITKTDSSGLGVGWFKTISDDWVRPAMWSDTEIHELPFNGIGGGANATNGTIVLGELFEPEFRNNQLVAWDISGSTIPMPQIVSGVPASGSVLPYGVNSAGAFVGQWYDNSDPTFETLRSYVGQGLQARDWRPLGQEPVRANDINDTGQVAGEWLLPDRRLAFVADSFDSPPRMLDLLPGFYTNYLEAINNEGWAVGQQDDQFGTVGRAVLFAPGSSEPIDINSLVNLPGVNLFAAWDINNRGQILVNGTRTGPNDSGWYVLTPIPEPAGAVVVGALWLSRAARRRRGVDGGVEV